MDTQEQQTLGELIKGLTLAVEEQTRASRKQTEAVEELKDNIYINTQVQEARHQASLNSIPIPVVQRLLWSLVVIILIMLGGTAGIKALPHLGQ